VFDDGERMSRFDAVFANRYLDALRTRRSRDDACRHAVVLAVIDALDGIATTP
jgi:hypothetical protein